MELFHIFAALAALGYAVAAVFAKQALSKGAGILRLSFVMNLTFLPIFATLLIRHEGAIPWSSLYQPALVGGLFFLGQVFTFSAIRMGDVSLQTPMMGTKAVFAVLIAVICGTEVVDLPLFLAAFVAMLSVALLGFSGRPAEKVGISITMALLSSLFFAGADTLVGIYASEFGVHAFLFIVMLVNALLSFALLPYFNGPLRAIPRGAWPWMVAACLLMGAQALLLNYTLGRYQHVAEVNVLYSMRGLWSVVFSALALRAINKTSEADDKRIYIMRFSGALMMCTTIAILFLPQP